MSRRAIFCFSLCCVYRLADFRDVEQCGGSCGRGGCLCTMST